MAELLEQLVATERELRRMEQAISRQTITDGEFWGLRIGDSRLTVIEQLRSLGIEHVRPEVLHQIRVTSPKEMSRLRDSEAVILFPGDARVTFSEDQVRERQVLPSVKFEWKARLETATTRDEVFSVFAEILEADKRAVVGNFAPGSRWVKLAGISKDDLRLLERYDAWELNRKNQDGFWHVRLEFAEGRLARLIAQRSPTELP